VTVHPEPNGQRNQARDGKQDMPETPTELSGGSWLAAAKRSVQEFQDDALTDRAATLTYYAVLAIFPGLLFLVSLLGLLGKRPPSRSSAISPRRYPARSVTR
jgi:membrane protein